MKQRIALGTALLLTLGTAVAGTFLYGHESQGGTTQQVSPSLFTVQEVTPDVIEAWKATSLASDYMPPKVPI